MIKGRKRMFDDRFGETIGSFLDYSQSASITYKGGHTVFNTFISPHEYRKGLNQMYEKAKDKIEIEVHQTEDKYQKSLFVGHVLTETSAALALLGKDRDSNFSHKNFPKTESKGKTFSETDFQDFYYWSDHFLRKMVTFLDSIMVSIGRIEQEVSVIKTTEETKPIYNSFNLIVTPKKSKAIFLFKALAELGCMAQSSEIDFVNAFTGNPVTKKINWIGNFGDLKTFINWSIEKGLIEKSRRQLIITSNVFTAKGIAFNSKAIKDTKPSTKDAKIKRIVNSAT
jgi:hypothetical protein